MVMFVLGDDAVGVQWRDINSNLDLYASHDAFVHMTTQVRDAHWWTTGIVWSSIPLYIKYSIVTSYFISVLFSLPFMRYTNIFELW